MRKLLLKIFPTALAIGISAISLSFAGSFARPDRAPLAFPKVFSNLVRTPQPKELSLADRVAYQRAIEEVYWRHRIWPNERPDPKPSFDETMPPAQLEEIVRDYLRECQALEDYWQQPVRAEQLQAEMERMAQHTAQPEVLRELFAALGNNPFVIAECLARPTLSKRLLAPLGADDPKGKAALKSRLAQVVNQAPNNVRAPATAFALPAILDNGSPRSIWTVSWPNVLTPTQACIDAWSTTSTTNAPSARDFHSAVWTGSEMIVWGGESNGFPENLNTGGRYNPSTDSWTATSTDNAPSARRGHKAMWTGSEMIVWAGFDGSAYINTGGRYSPATNSWTATNTTNAPSARSGHTAIWTGNEMIVWGGFFYDGSTTVFNTGGRYDPATNSWTTTSTAGAPSARSSHTAIWTGNEMIVWGGGDTTGARYNPGADSWTAMSATNAPAARGAHTTVWTGSEMVVWGGQAGTFFVNTGGKYNPGTNSWTATTTNNAPTDRSNHTAVWTGSEMIIWGGNDNGFSSLNTGGRYSPGSNSWTPTSTANAPAARSLNSAVWTGSEMIVWGGVMPGAYLNSGAKYCGPATGPSPTPTPTPPAPTPTPSEPPTPTPTTFGFVPGHYYSSNYSSRIIKEYDGAGINISSYTIPPALGEEVRGLTFGADGLLYATVSRSSSGCAVLALRSDGSVAMSYTWPDNFTGGDITLGKIAMDNRYLYLSGVRGLLRFLLGDPSSGTSISTGRPICDVKPLPNGNLFVAFSGNIDEITTSGALVRHVTPYPFSALNDVRSMEYNPATNILFVTHLGFTNFFDRIMRFNATTGALLSDATFGNASDLFLDASGNLLAGSSSQNPTFFSQDLVQGNHLHGGQQLFVTQYAPSQALNISTRMRVETGNNVLIGGFIVNGTAPKTVAVRGIGPSLARFGIPDVLADPTLQLRDSSGALVRQNDNWQDDPSQASQLAALGLVPQDLNESGLVESLSPSAYTTILAGKNGGTGVGLVEIYDANSGATSQLANISTRGFVLTGSNVMIGGFILGGANNTHVAVRGIGPSLADLGLSPVLADPTLELRDSNGVLLFSNDNWQDDPVTAAQLTAFGLAPANAAESGIVVSALPGAFTAVLAGKNGGTGIGLVEIYNVH
jgi:N-acetylneuraminic acid mutarotase